MSEHDPFDGVYDRSMIAADEKPSQEAGGKSEQTLYDSASVHAEPEAEIEQDVQPSIETVYSSAFLRRQSKAELQAIARSKRLDDSGTRDEMIEAIEDHQNS